MISVFKMLRVYPRHPDGESQVVAFEPILSQSIHKAFVGLVLPYAHAKSISALKASTLGGDGMLPEQLKFASPTLQDSEPVGFGFRCKGIAGFIEPEMASFITSPDEVPSEVMKNDESAHDGLAFLRVDCGHTADSRPGKIHVQIQKQDIPMSLVIGLEALEVFSPINIRFLAGFEDEANRPEILTGKIYRGISLDQECIGLMINFSQSCHLVIDPLVGNVIVKPYQD
jgi:hypothetical protein